MIMKTLVDFHQFIKGACFFDEPLSKHTTLGIGGRVGLWLEPQDTEDLKCMIKELQSRELTWKIIGNGSNILAGERGLSNAVIRLNNFNQISCSGDIIRAGSGAGLGKLVSFSLEHSLTGLEFLAGIPGVVGGAARVNAGAQGCSISDVLKTVRMLNNKGEVYDLSAREIVSGYRYIDISDDTIILGAEFCLSRGDTEEMYNTVAGYLASRNDSFPACPNAGCIFKNPAELNAGALIEKAGLKGFSIGNAGVSREHGNIFVNLGRADAGCVMALIRHVRKEVYARTGINLELEVNCWGDI